MPTIDVHAHVFPDDLARRAVPFLEEEGDLRAYLDGTVSSLLRSMDEAGIDISVVCSIATRPGQFRPILDWSLRVASDRLIPLPSVHPRDPLAAERARTIAEEGLEGIKLHPYYQDFFLDDESMFPLYEAAERHDLILVVHTGFDLAFERVRRADPARVLRILERFPRLRFLATHLGAWRDWGEARRLLIGKPIWIETSFSIHMVGRSAAREMILAHPQDRILFGTDSPWMDQKESLEEIRGLELGPEREKRILGENARELLRLP